MGYITIKELTNKNNLKYNEKIVSRRTIFRILKRYREGDKRIPNLCKIEKNNTVINEDFLYLFYSKIYKKKCNQYTEITVNLNDDFDYNYYEHIAQLISDFFERNIKFCIEKVANRYHVHTLIKVPNVNKELLIKDLNSKLKIDTKYLFKNINVEVTRDLDKYVSYMSKSTNIKQTMR